MWNIREINKKKKHCVAILSNEVLNNGVKEELQFSLLAYLQMLDSSGTVFYTKVPKIIDAISSGKYTLQREKTYQKVIQDLDMSGGISYYELMFLVRLALAIADDESKFQKYNFEKLDIDSDQLMLFAKDFYKQLGDKEICDLALRLLANEDHYNFTRNFRYKKDNLGGEMHWDFVFNNPYLNIYQHDTICDFNSIVHETMHAVDFSFLPKIRTRFNTVVAEIPTFTTDFLVIDYLENLGFNQEELDKYRKQVYLNIQALADRALTLIKRRFQGMQLDFNENNNINLVVDLLTPNLISLLIKFKAAMVSYGLYLQILTDKEKGLNNLKKYMQQGISKNQELDFRFVDLSDQRLLEIASEFKNQVNALDNQFRRGSY